MPWSAFRGTAVSRCGYRKPAQRALRLLEYRDVFLATTGNRFTIFRGREVDPSSSAVLEHQEHVAADAEPLAFAAFCDDTFPAAANPAHFVGDRLARVHFFAEGAGVAPGACLFGGVTTPYLQFALDRVCPGGRVARPDRVYRVAHLMVLSSTGEPGGHPFYYLNPGAMDFVIPPLVADLPRGGGGRRLYLARTDATARVLVNERALMARLAGEGFEVHEMGRLAPRDQLALVREAEIVVAPHGAALTNLVAARPGARVVELFNPARATTAYMAIAHGRGAPYTPIIGDPVANPALDDPWTVDIDAVIEATR